jgi:uncharacterized protein (TIGR03067 family)
MYRVFCCCLLVLGLVAATSGAETPVEFKPFQGVWVIEDATLGGRDHKDDFAGMKLTVTGENYVIDFLTNSDKGTIKLDATKSPKQIDLTTRKDGPFKGRTLPGIYEFKGDTVVLCLNSEKPDRPTAFESKVKTPIMLLTFKRDKK